MNYSEDEVIAAIPARSHELFAELEETFLGLQRLILPRNALAGDGEITRPQYLLLHVIDRQGPASVTDLAGVLDVGLPATSGMIDRLERSGFVTRERDSADRRVIRVALTAAGRVRLRELEARVRAEFRAALSVLSDAEIATLIRLYQKLVDGATASRDDV